MGATQEKIEILVTAAIEELKKVSSGFEDLTKKLDKTNKETQKADQELKNLGRTIDTVAKKSIQQSYIQPMKEADQMTKNLAKTISDFAQRTMKSEHDRALKDSQRAWGNLASAIKQAVQKEMKEADRAARNLALALRDAAKAADKEQAAAMRTASRETKFFTDLQYKAADSMGKIKLKTEEYRQKILGLKTATDAQKQAMLALLPAIEKQSIAMMNAHQHGNNLKNTLLNMAIMYARILQILGLVRVAFSVIDRGAKFDAVSKSYENMTQRMGRATATLLQSLRELSLGTVSNFDLMLQANVALGAKFKNSEILLFMERARQVSRTFGVETSDAFQRLIKSIITAEQESVDQWGLQVNLNQVYKEYKAILHIVGRELTEAEKRQARFNAIIRDTAGKFSDLDPKVANYKDKLEQVKAASSNLLDNLGLATLVSAATIWTFMERSVNKFRLEVEATERKSPELISAIERQNKEMKLLGYAFDEVTGKMDAHRLAWERIKEAAKMPQSAESLLGDARIKSAEQLMFRNPTPGEEQDAGKFAERVAEQAASASEKITLRYKKEREELEKLKFALGEKYAATKKNLDIAEKEERANLAEKMMKPINAEMEKFSNWLAKITQKGQDDPYQKLAVSLAEYRRELEQFNKPGQRAQGLAAIAEIERVEKEKIFQKFIEDSHKASAELNKMWAQMKTDKLKAMADAMKDWADYAIPQIQELTDAWNMLNSQALMVTEEELDDLRFTFLRFYHEGKIGIIELINAMIRLKDLTDKKKHESKGLIDVSKEIREAYDAIIGFINDPVKKLQDAMVKVWEKFKYTARHSIDYIATFMRDAFKNVFDVLAQSDFFSVTAKGIKDRAEEIRRERRESGREFTPKQQAEREAEETKKQFAIQASAAIGETLGGPIGAIFGQMIGQQEGVNKALGEIMVSFGKLIEAVMENPLMKLMLKSIEYSSKILGKIFDVLGWILNALNPAKWLQGKYESQAEKAKETGKRQWVAGGTMTNPGPGYWINPDGSRDYTDKPAGQKQSYGSGSVPAYSAYSRSSNVLAFTPRSTSSSSSTPAVSRQSSSQAYQQAAGNVFNANFYGGNWTPQQVGTALRQREIETEFVRFMLRMGFKRG